MQPQLSILIPAYNEIATIARIIDIVQGTLPDVRKEIIVVDDGSTDGTREYLRDTFGSIDEAELTRIGSEAYPGRQLSDQAVLKPVFHERNKGKGGAIQTALAACTGDVIVIQDADLEYDPADWIQMYDLIAIRKVADVVYGSRFYGRPHRSLYYHHYLANRLISTVFNILYNQTLTDIETCYKMFTREVRRSLNLSAPDFGIEIQISAQIALFRRWRIYELGICYFGRTYDEGKKISWRDGLKALWYLVRYRITSGT
jgi:glycosyltransferase involved in cell wall biosynthesis